MSPIQQTRAERAIRQPSEPVRQITNPLYTLHRFLNHLTRSRLLNRLINSRPFSNLPPFTAMSVCPCSRRLHHHPSILCLPILYPQPVSPQPGSFGQPIGYPPPQTKSRAGCWIAAIIILVLLVGGGSGAYYYFTRVNPNPLFTQFTSSPQQTLQTYCNALKSGDYQTAYNQFSTRAQSQISESDFAKSLQTAFATLGGLKDCTVGTVKQTSSTTATGSVTYTFGDGRTIPGNGRLVYESGAWKMDASNNINS